MAHPKARYEKGTAETQARMAALSQKAKQAREAQATPVLPEPVVDRKPFIPQGVPNMSVDVNEFTGVQRGFPHMNFAGMDVLQEPKRIQSWPGDGSV